MCEKATDPYPPKYDSPTNQATQTRESNMIYELKQQRENHIRELVNIQKAIEAVSMVNNLY